MDIPGMGCALQEMVIPVVDGALCELCTLGFVVPCENCASRVDGTTGDRCLWDG